MRNKRLIAIASGKGGVGKTWFAITLAHALALAGRRVLLVDADLGLANVDIQLGLNPRCDLAAVLGRRAPLREAVLRHAGGFDILPGSSGTGALAALGRAGADDLLRLLREAEAEIVLLDLGAGIAPATRHLAASADTLLLLATAEPTSLTDGYAVLKLFLADQPGGDARIVINQAASEAEAARSFATLSRACSRFLGAAPPLAGVIRRDRLVPDAIRRQALLMQLYPASAAVEGVRAVAAAVVKG
jgi:flagellar biosynthesis protein FlhG